jgi:predicted  nucleic acid-binding Zn-ribbon protein
MDQEYKGKKTGLETKLNDLKSKFEEINADLNQKQAELNELSRQTEEEENELKEKREQLLPSINAEDIELYDRVNDSKFGDAIAVVRKNSCLGCFSSIPPQRSIEIRMANRFFHCEACGRILIAEEMIAESSI